MNWLGNLFGGGGKPDRNKFGAIVSKHLAAQGDVPGKLVYDAQEFAVKVVAEDGGIARSYYLQNAYDDYCRSAPENRAGVLDAYFQTPPEVPEKLHDAITHIMPRLQMRTFFGSILLQSRLGVVPAQQAETFVYRVVAENFAAALIYDSEKHVSYVPAQKYKDWDVSFDELFERALVNLDRVTPEPFQRAQAGFYYSHYQDTHDATRALLRGRVSECRLNGRPVAVMPNRNRLFLVGEDDFAAQDAMLSWTSKSLQEESRPQPVFPIVFDGNEWVAWAPSDANPHAEKFKRMVATAWNEEYTTQKSYLDAIHQKEQKDVFVANYMLFQDQSGKLHSVATLTNGVPTFIPKADEIAFVKSEKESTIVEWDAAAEVLGARMKSVEGLWPLRWFVDYFPTDEELAKMEAMGKAAVDA